MRRDVRRVGELDFLEPDPDERICLERQHLSPVPEPPHQRVPGRAGHLLLLGEIGQAHTDRGHQQRERDQRRQQHEEDPSVLHDADHDQRDQQGDPRASRVREHQQSPAREDIGDQRDLPQLAGRRYAPAVLNCDHT